MSPMASDSTTSAAPLIEAHGITKHYDGFSLQDVNLTVDEGEVVGFVGQNGAGKSTTIKALLGIIELDGGEVKISAGRIELSGGTVGIDGALYINGEKYEPPEGAV